MTGELDSNQKNILEILEAFRTRKDMYIDPVCPEEAEKWLYGFDVGCFACGVQIEWQIALEKRGWELRSTTSPIHEMRVKGLSDEQIIDELVALREDAVRYQYRFNTSTCT